MKRALVALALSAVFLPLALSLRFDTRPFTALGHDPVFTRLARLLAEREILVIMLEADAQVQSAELVQAAGELDAALAGLPGMESVVGHVGVADASKLIDAAYVLWPEEQLPALAALLTREALRKRAQALRAATLMPGGRALLSRAFVDPLELAPTLMRSVAGERGVIDASSGYLIAGSAHIVSFFARPKAASKDSAQARVLLNGLTAIGARLHTAHPGIALRLTGPHVFAVEYETRLRSGLALSGALSLLLVVAWCVVLLGDLRFMALAGLTLGVAAVWALGIARVLFFELQILAVSAASILPALGIDAAVQFHAAFSAGKGDGKTRVAQATRAVQRPILVAAAASFLGFLAFLSAEVTAFRQFGALLAIGVVCNTAAMALVLPPACLFLDRLQPAWLARAPRRGVVEALGAWLGRKTPVTRYLPVLAALFVIVLHPPLQRAFGFFALVEPSMQGAIGQRAFERGFSASQRHLFVLIDAASEDDAILAERALSARLVARPELPVVREGMALLAATASDLARARAFAAIRPLPAVQADWEAALRDADFADETIHKLSAPIATMNAGPPALPALAAFFATQRLRTDASGAQVYVSLFLAEGADTEDAARQIETLAAALPHARSVQLSGPALVDLRLQNALAGDALKLTVLALGGALLAMALSRMAWRRLLMAASSLALLFICLYGALALTQVQLTLVTLLVFPFVLGVGIDATVYLVEHEEFGRDPEALLRGHLRPLLASTLTTLSGFLALVAVPLAQIQCLGLAVAMGLAIALVIALSWVAGARN